MKLWVVYAVGYYRNSNHGYFIDEAKSTRILRESRVRRISLGLVY